MEWEAQVTGSEVKRKAHGNTVLCTGNHDLFIYWIMIITMLDGKTLKIAGNRHRVVPDPPGRRLHRQEGPRVDQAREDDADNVDDVDNHDDIDNVDDVDNHDDVDDDDRGLTRHEKRFGITSFIYRARYLVAEYGTGCFF